MESHCRQLLDLIPDERGWMVKGMDRGGDGFRVAEERKLELRLAPPGVDWWPDSSSSAMAKKTQDLEAGANSGQAPAHGSSGARNADAANTSSTRNVNAPVVGWPPIRSFRKNLTTTSKPSPESQKGGLDVPKKADLGRKGLFVKINMDGIPIGRKVDLMAYDSYERLSLAVDELFRGLLSAQRDPLSAGAQKNAGEKPTITGILDGSGEYTLVYEDEEGDRMLVGDVPWDMFVSMVKRLRVLKSSELSTLSLGALSRKRTAAEC